MSELPQNTVNERTNAVNYGFNTSVTGSGGSGMPPPGYPQQPQMQQQPQVVLVQSVAPHCGTTVYCPQRPYDQCHAGQWPHYTSMQQQPQVVLMQSVVPCFGEHSVAMQCPHCRAQITTTTYYEAGTFAWLLCIVCLVFGLWLGCCLIPLMMDGCKDVQHKCPNCHASLGWYRRM